MKSSETSRYVEDKFYSTHNHLVEEREHKYFERNKQTHKIHERNQIRNISYNPSGDILSYHSGGNLVSFNIHDKTFFYSTLPKLVDFKYLQKNTIVYSETNKNELKYYSTYDNCILRKFTGVTNKINHFDVDDVNDYVLGISDNEAALWDMRCVNPILKVNKNENMHLGCLSNSNTFVLATNDSISLFDIRNYKMSFDKYVQPNFYREISFFSNDSKLLMKTENSYYFYSEDFELKTFITLENKNSGAITPGGKNLLCCSKNYVFSYLVDSRKKVDLIDLGNSNHTIRVSPAGDQFVAAGDNNITFVNWEGWRWYYGLDCYSRFYENNKQ